MDAPTFNLPAPAFPDERAMNNVWRVDAMQNHIHDADDVSEALLFLAEEGPFLKRLEVLGRKIGLGA